MKIHHGSKIEFAMITFRYECHKMAMYKPHTQALSKNAPIGKERLNEHLLHL